eukprot:2281070-Prymnesium_polylepis.3
MKVNEVAEPSVDVDIGSPAAAAAAGAAALGAMRQRDEGAEAACGSLVAERVPPPSEGPSSRKRSSGDRGGSPARIGLVW